MKRILLMVAYNILLVPIFWFKLCYYAKHVEKYTEEERYALLRFIDRRAIKGGRITIDIHGQENYPKESGFMMFPNHQGLFDVLAIMQTCEKPFSVVMKKEVQNVPFLKQVFACMKAYAIDREDVRQSMKVIQQVAKEVQSGRNYLIFPEGTRSKGGVMHPMQAGSMQPAFMAKACIVPIVLKNSYDYMDVMKHKGTFHIHILKPLYYEDYKPLKAEGVTVQLQEEMQRVLDEA